MGESQNNTLSVLITGGNRGIGRALVLACAEAGYEAVFTYRSGEAQAQETLDLVKSQGGRARTFQLDVADRSACAQRLLADIEAHGTYYGVILNAGVTADNAFPSITGEDWDKVIDTNLGGFYNVLNPLIIPMVRRRAPGRIITLSSVSGVMGNRGQVNYSASKAGLIGATKALAVEMGKRDITVNCIAPGVIETDMADEVPWDHIKESVPLRRMGQPAEVAALAVYLLSPLAGYITRQVISINGGMF